MRLEAPYSVERGASTSTVENRSGPYTADSVKALSHVIAAHDARDAVKQRAHLPARAIFGLTLPSIHLRTRRASATRVSLPKELSSTMTVGRF